MPNCPILPTEPGNRKTVPQLALVELTLYTPFPSVWIHGREPILSTNRQRSWAAESRYTAISEFPDSPSRRFCLLHAGPGRHGSFCPKQHFYAQKEVELFQFERLA